MKTIAIFADIQNIYYTTRQAYARKFDYTAFWNRVSVQGQIVLANAYAIDRNDRDQLRFQGSLKRIGFDIKLKPYLLRRDGSAKGDWDVGITIDVLESAPKVNTIVLLSGDGDFSLLIEKVKKDFNVESEVYGVPSLTSKSLIEAASIFHPINENLLLV